MLLENCDLLTHTLEMQMHQRLPDCHQTVQEVSGHMSEYPLCMLILPTLHHSRQCASQHRPHSIHLHHLHTSKIVDPRRSRKSHVRCETRLLSLDKSRMSTAATIASDFLAFESLAASAASPHCVLKASSR